MTRVTPLFDLKPSTSPPQGGQHIFQSLLRQKLGEFRTKNPQFSVRAFARKIGLQPSAANEILKGERRVSLKLAARVSDRLFLAPHMKQRLLKCMAVESLGTRELRPDLELDSPETNIEHYSLPGKSSRNGPPGDSALLSADQYEILEDWVHLAILSLIKTRGFQSDAKWIATRLGTPNRRIITALERLKRLKLIEKNRQGRFVRTKSQIHTSEDIANVAIQRAHLSDLELAKEALHHVPIELRDFSSITFPASPTLLPKAKEILRRAQDDVEALLESEPGTEVYRLCTLLLPLTQTESLSKNPVTKKTRSKTK